VNRKQTNNSIKIQTQLQNDYYKKRLQFYENTTLSIKLGIKDLN